MATKRKPPHELPPEEQLVAKIEEVRRSRSKADKQPSASTAIATLHRLEADLLRELRDLRAPAAVAPVSPVAGLTDAELLDGLCAAVAGLPDAALDRLDAALAQRRTGRPALRVVQE